MPSDLYGVAQQIMREAFPDCDLVGNPTTGIQRHPHGLVGTLFRLRDPDTVRIGNCFLAGRLKAGDLFLCEAHSGDCFQNYRFVDEYVNGLRGTKWTFGSYGIGDAERVADVTPAELESLKECGFVDREPTDAE